MKRAHMASLSSMATSDSIPVCASVDVDKLSNPLKAALYSGFLQCNRVLFTEVCSDQTYIVNDSCSDTKLATIPYETGVTPNPPLEQDIISILNPTASKNKLEQATKACLPHQHPLRKFGKLLFYANSRTGAKTGTAHLNKKATLPSSHFSRLNAVHWVAMCWIQGKPCKVMGAFAVGMTGGSPQGNQAEPTNLCHLPLEEARAGYLAASEQAFLLLQEYHTIVTNLHLGDEYTRVVKAEESLKSATRSVESWIKHQSIQSSDLEALARAAYKYMPPLYGGQHPVMQHVCLSEAAEPPPPYPPTLTVRFSPEKTSNALNPKHSKPPPEHLWVEGKPPRLPRGTQELLPLLQWWEEVRVSSETFTALTENSSSRVIVEELERERAEAWFCCDSSGSAVATPRRISKRVKDRDPANNSRPRPRVGGLEQWLRSMAQ